MKWELEDVVNNHIKIKPPKTNGYVYKKKETVSDLMEIVYILMIVVLALLFYIAYKVREQGLTKTDLQAVSEGIVGVESRIGTRIDNIVGIVGELKSTTESVGKIGSELKIILSGERRRGELGEILIENILSDILPKDCYDRQVSLGGGIADYVVKTRDCKIPIDSKFPLENYKKMIEASDEKDRKSYHKKFLTDVRKHIDNTSKFVLPQEGTTDYALMYVPAESIHFEIIENMDIVRYTYEKRVLICSPINFYYILHALNVTIKREKLPEKIEALYGEFLELKGDLEDFESAFSALERHIARAYSKSNEARGVLSRVQRKASEIVLEEEIE
ncbi:MAG: DNA recombination protein RmuC [Euryarchaeota archaeon]|nr:DNA recombination protein RmuC [Euryarchaeota archaeon]